MPALLAVVALQLVAVAVFAFPNPDAVTVRFLPLAARPVRGSADPGDSFPLLATRDESLAIPPLRIFPNQQPKFVLGTPRRAW
jgi:hypothetical protein